MTDDVKIESVATLMYSELEGTHPLDWITLELGDQKKYLDLAKKALELLSTAVTSLPEQRDVGRYEDMSPNGHLRVGLDADNDVYVSVFDDKNKTSSSVEFCTVGNGGGRNVCDHGFFNRGSCRFVLGTFLHVVEKGFDVDGVGVESYLTGKGRGCLCADVGGFGPNPDLLGLTCLGGFHLFMFLFTFLQWELVVSAHYKADRLIDAKREFRNDGQVVIVLLRQTSCQR